MQSDGSLPSLPPAMIVSTYILREEEEKLCISTEHTNEYRDQLQIPHSDDVRALEADLKQEAELKCERSNSNATPEAKLAKKRRKE
jgi:hypothetical protein